MLNPAWQSFPRSCHSLVDTGTLPDQPTPAFAGRLSSLALPGLPQYLFSCGPVVALAYPSLSCTFSGPCFLFLFLSLSLFLVHLLWNGFFLQMKVIFLVEKYNLGWFKCFLCLLLLIFFVWVLVLSVDSLPKCCRLKPKQRSWNSIWVSSLSYRNLGD